MEETKIRCPAYCVKIDKEGKPIIKGYLELIKDQEHPTGRLFCLTYGCPFAFRDEYNKDQWYSNADLLKLPIEDPLT